MDNEETVTVTASELLDRVREIAEERRDRVYTPYGDAKSGLYVHPDGSEGCLFGVALLSLGIPREVLARHDEDTVFDLPFVTGDTMSRYRFVGMQIAQDGGFTWGKVVGGMKRDILRITWTDREGVRRTKDASAHDPHAWDDWVREHGDARDVMTEVLRGVWVS